MREVLYESEIFAKDNNSKIFPFKIVIDSNVEKGIKTINIYRIEYRSDDKGDVFENTTILNSNFWKLDK